VTGAAALAGLGAVLLVWTSVHLWRNLAYTTSNKVGWQLVVGGLVVGPLVSFGNGWFLGFPLGALAYVLLAEHGPVRGRRAAPDGDAPARPEMADPDG
jgi:hypothetical protein